MPDPQIVNEENAELLMQCGNEIMKKIKKKKNIASERSETEKDMQKAEDMVNSIVNP